MITTDFTNENPNFFANQMYISHCAGIKYRDMKSIEIYLLDIEPKLGIYHRIHAAKSSIVTCDYILDSMIETGSSTTHIYEWYMDVKKILRKLLVTNTYLSLGHEDGL